MKTYLITEKQSAKGALFKAEGFLQGKTYRALVIELGGSAVLRIMTRSPNARHPGEWPDPPESLRPRGAEQLITAHDMAGCNS